MVLLASLWLPIVLSAVFVFVVSSIMHMVLKYHRNDVRPLGAGEDALMEAVRALKLAPGEYAAPMPASMAAMNTPEFQAKRKKGPVFLLRVMPSGEMNMGSNLLNWFIYSLVVSVLSAYVAAHTLSSGTSYLIVFRIVGTVAFMSYGVGQWQDVVWMGRSKSVTLVGTIDALVYGLVTAGTFGWLWPK